MSAPLVTIKRLSLAREDEFFRLHSEATGNGWCRCVAWWVPNWDKWSERSTEENEALRRRIFRNGVHDGYLLYADGELAGWCQAWLRDAFPKVAVQYGLPSDEDAWAIGCVLVLPQYRAQGVAREALVHVIDDLKLRGARTVDVFPKRNASDESELWNGAESTYRRLGFTVVRDDAKRPLLRLSL